MTTSYASRGLLVGAGLGAALCVVGTARAHFVLQTPDAVYEQSAQGDPQKDAPCGDNGAAVATMAVTSVQAGQTITITIDETVFHPGHYRIALATNDESELPPPPDVTPSPNDQCASVPIQDPPVFPVLADGVFQHDAPFDGPQSIDITIPDDVSCDNCTLQVIQYMSSHGAPCFYYHCAKLEVQGGPVDTTTATGDDGPGSTDDGVDTTLPPASTGDETAANPDTGDDGPIGDASASGGDDDGAPTTTAANTEGEASGEGDGGGCGCSQRSAGPSALFGLLALLGLRRRGFRGLT